MMQRIVCDSDCEPVDGIRARTGPVMAAAMRSEGYGRTRQNVEHKRPAKRTHPVLLVMACQHRLRPYGIYLGERYGRACRYKRDTVGLHPGNRQIESRSVSSHSR